MKVKELMKHLENCNPESIVYSGPSFDDVEEVTVVAEITASNEYNLGVHITTD